MGWKGEDVLVDFVVSTGLDPLKDAVLDGNLASGGEHTLPDLLGASLRGTESEVDDERSVGLDEGFTLRQLTVGVHGGASAEFAGGNRRFHGGGGDGHEDHHQGEGEMRLLIVLLLFPSCFLWFSGNSRGEFPGFFLPTIVSQPNNNVKRHIDK